jgi:hypothetical protein
LFDDRTEKILPADVLAKADEQLKSMPPAARCNYEYFLGELLSLQGDQEQAENYWRKAVSLGPFDNHSATLAGQRLVAQHGKSRPDPPDRDAEEVAENSL